MRKVVDKAFFQDRPVNIVKISTNKGQLDRFNIEPREKPGVLAHASTLAEARRLCKRVIHHPVKTQPTKAECLALNLTHKQGKKKKG